MPCLFKFVSWVRANEPHDNGKATEEARLESSMLTGRTLAVVVIIHDDPLDTLITIVGRSLWDGVPVGSNLILDLVGLTTFYISSTNQAVLSPPPRPS
jgi:hypothetical protein